MNNYAAYHYLRNPEEVFREEAVENSLSENTSEMIRSIDAEKYRIAVIGECKRGKSSLINAIWGADILPSDILPLTAVNCRIIQGKEKKAVIYFKNGAFSELGTDELKNYTKRAVAENNICVDNIKEIVVHYPTSFGQGNIEIIDTPGFNDDENAVKRISEAIGAADTVIAVISATMPLSFSEQKIICELIKQPHIYNLIFAVTFIDRISEEKKEQNRLLDNIRQRLCEDTYSYFLNNNGGDSQLLEKARLILGSPQILPVSPKLAINGITDGNESLIKKSRIRDFIQSLDLVITKNREKEALMQIRSICSQAENAFEENIKAKTSEDERIFTEKQERTLLLEEGLSEWAVFPREIMPEYSELTAQTVEQKTKEITGRPDIISGIKEICTEKLSLIKDQEFIEEKLKEVLGQARRVVRCVVEKIGRAICEATSKIAECTYKKLLSKMKNSDNCISYVKRTLRKSGADFTEAVIRYNDTHRKRMFNGLNYVKRKAEEILQHYSHSEKTEDEK